MWDREWFASFDATHIGHAYVFTSLRPQEIVQGVEHRWRFVACYDGPWHKTDELDLHVRPKGRAARAREACYACAFPRESQVPIIKLYGFVRLFRGDDEPAELVWMTFAEMEKLFWGGDAHVLG